MQSAGPSLTIHSLHSSVSPCQSTKGVNRHTYTHTNKLFNRLPWSYMKVHWALTVITDWSRQKSHVKYQALTACTGSTAASWTVWNACKPCSRLDSRGPCYAAGSSCHRQNSSSANESSVHCQVYATHSLHICDNSASMHAHKFMAI